jgi:hypothetical protein
VLHDRHLTVGKFDSGSKVGDFHEMVLRDRTIQIHRNHHEHVGGNYHDDHGRGRGHRGLPGVLGGIPARR